MSTISSSTGHGVTLGSSGYASPLTITNAGYVTNAGSGTAVYDGSAGGTLVNQGMVKATGNYDAVILGRGGNVFNQASGVIASGSRFGIRITNGGSGATIVNAGTIFAATGVYADNISQTLIDTGTIIGTGGTAIQFGAGNNLVQFQPGDPLIQGTVSGGGGSSTLEFASGASTGTLAGSNADFINFSTATVDSGATWELAGNNNFGGGVVLTNSGTLLNAGSLTGDQLNLRGGQLTNLIGGVISSAYIYGASGTTTGVVNQGTISTPNSIVNYAILLAGQGNLSNGAGALISGYYGVELKGINATVINLGQITATSTAADPPAVYMVNGGVVINGQAGGSASPALIQSYFGIVFLPDDTGSNTGTVINYGTVQGTGPTSPAYAASAVFLKNGGVVVNGPSGATGALLKGQIFGVYSIADTQITNYGTIQATFSRSEPNGSYGVGIRDSLSSSLSNLGSASLIEGYGGVFLEIGGTVTNAGTIESTQGTSGIAVTFSGGNARLIDIPGAVFVGQVNGGADLTNALELASGASVGTLSGIGGQFTNFTTVMVDPNTSWTLTGDNTLTAASTFTNAGTLLTSGALVADAGAVVNNGVMVLDPSTMTVASLTGNGSVTIEAGSTLVVAGSISSGETIVFTGSGSYLDLQGPNSVAGTINDLAVGETIDLKGIAPGTVSYNDGEIQFNGSDAFPLTLASGNAPRISASSDGTDLTALCFCFDTMIQTPLGQVKVQDLAVGDLVMTLDGHARPLEWIGTGAVLATRGRRNAATPVVVCKGALADNVPSQDLRVTKGHSLYFEGVLIPVEFLVNHRSIHWDDRAQEVVLYHLELATHDVLLANGAPAESYRDDGNRWLFRNANSGWDQPPKPPCAPVLTGGELVDSIWRQLLDRSGPRANVPMTDDPDLHLMVDGRRLDATERAGDALIFAVANRSEAVRIVSRAAVPQELGLARDPRSLGVALRQVVVRKGTKFRLVEANDPRLEQGFHGFEADNGFVWTNGDAALPTTLLAGFSGPVEIVLTVAGTTHYIDDGVRPLAAGMAESFAAKQFAA